MRAPALAALCLAAVASLGMSAPGSHRYPNSRTASTRYTAPTCGADPCCWVLADTNANGNWADDWQGAYNTRIGLGATCSGGITFLPPTTAGPHDLTTEVRICKSASAGSGTSPPTCASGTGHPPIKFRGLWNTDAHVLRCKATAGGTVPEGCLWLGNSWAEGTQTSNITLDIPVRSAPYIEQYTQIVSLSPFQGMTPFLCDGCTGTYALHIRTSNRQDGTTIYYAPVLMGDSQNVSVFSDKNDPTPGRYATWGSYLTFIGNNLSVHGNLIDLVPSLGSAAIGGDYIYSDANNTFCKWSAAHTQAVTCSGTFGPDFSVNNVNSVLEAGGMSINDFTSATLSGVFSDVGALTFKTLIYTNKTIDPTTLANGKFGTLNLSGQFYGAPTSLNSVILLASKAAPTGVVNFSGYISEPYPLSDVADKVGLRVLPHVALAGQIIKMNLLPGARYSSLLGFLVPLSDGTVTSTGGDIDTTAPGLGTMATYTIPVQGAVATDSCITPGTGLVASCASEATKTYLPVTTMIYKQTFTLTSAVTGGKTCTFHNWINGATPVCPGCGADANGTYTFNYGSAGLVNNTDSVTARLWDVVPAGGYYQLKVDGSGTCSLTGSMTVVNSIYNAF